MSYLVSSGIGYQNAYFRPVCSLDTPDTAFSFLHIPPPIFLSDNSQKLLDFLLWYTPGTSSYQSRKNPVISTSPLQNPLFSEIFLLLVFQKMGVHVFDDIFVDDSKGSVSSMIGKITHCPKCSKIVFLVNASRYVFSWNFFRHLRNSIAHGCFNRLTGTDIFVFEDVATPNRHGATPSGYIRISFSSFLASIATYAPSLPELDIPRLVRSCGEALYLSPIEIAPIVTDSEKESEFVGFHKKNEVPLLVDCSFVRKREGPIGCGSQFIRRILYRQQSALAANPGFQFVALSPFNTFTNKTWNLFQEKSIRVVDKKLFEIYGKDIVGNLQKSPSN
jgi:hypothetical protein